MYDSEVSYSPLTLGASKLRGNVPIPSDNLCPAHVGTTPVKWLEICVEASEPSIASSFTSPNRMPSPHNWYVRMAVN